MKQETNNFNALSPVRAIAQTTVPKRPAVHQLDLLRGLAIGLMVVNHVGTRVLARDLGSAGLDDLVFIGSFAPVIFFFTTGFGVGFSIRRVDSASFLSSLLKAGLLVVADQFMFWSIGEAWGLDFLGFIGISTLLVTGVSISLKPIRLCVAIMVCVVVIRFGIGGSYRGHIGPTSFTAWFIGTPGIPRVSYPFSPWIVYPLIGFLLGRRYRALYGSRASFPGPWIYVSAVVALIAAVALHEIHEVFFRWGTVSFAYFVLSIGILFLTLIVAWKVADHWRRAAQLLSLRGISSLAVVPIHYGLIELVVTFGGAPMGALATLATMSLVLASSVILSRIFARNAERWIPQVAPAVSWVALSCVVGLCVVVCWCPFQQAIPRFVALIIGQLGISALLVVRSGIVSSSLGDKQVIH